MAETNDVTNTPPVTNEGTAEEIVDNSIGDYEDADWEEEEVIDTDFSDEEDSEYEDDFMDPTTKNLKKRIGKKITIFQMTLIKKI